MARYRLYIVALVPGYVGCTTNHADMLHFLREHEHRVSAMEYRVGVPDTIAISAPRILEIDGETQRIQPDGKITLRLLGSVKIVDMTAKEIAAKLEVLLSRYYVDPKVSVRIVGYASKKYYVCSGRRMAPRPYTGHDTLLDAVVSAGVDFRSWTSQVKVTRPSHGSVPIRKIMVNVDQMIKNGDWSKNILLEPDDIVHVPLTPIAWVAERLRELVHPVGPVIRAYTAPAHLMYMDDAYDRDNYGWRGYGYGGY